ncbi:hypothetical protein DPEC_G00370540 [Dallia pectoralis]|nr:hypothetical protein DPEC_G00370540 [Dallia pectoralis]
MVCHIAQEVTEQRFLQKQQQELNETLQKGVQEHKRKVASMEWDITVKTQQDAAKPKGESTTCLSCKAACGNLIGVGY